MIQTLVHDVDRLFMSILCDQASCTDKTCLQITRWDDGLSEQLEGLGPTAISLEELGLPDLARKRIGIDRMDAIAPLEPLVGLAHRGQYANHQQHGRLVFRRRVEHSLNGGPRIGLRPA